MGIFCGYCNIAINIAIIRLIQFFAVVKKKKKKKKEKERDTPKLKLVVSR